MDWDIEYRTDDHRGTATISGPTPEEAIRRNLRTLSEIGVGGPAGIRLTQIDISDLRWTPRPVVGNGIYGTVGEIMKNNKGLPLIGNTDAWRFRAVLTVRHPDVYIGPNADAEPWEETLLMRPVRSKGGRPAIGGAIHVRLGDGLLQDVTDWATHHGMDRAQAVRLLLQAGLDVAQNDADTA